MARIFISHSGKNNFAAIALRDWITAGGWDDHPFLDLDPERGIAAGERWERALHEAADRCEVVLFLVSRDWLKSDWCVKEFNLAQKLNKRLFGVLIDDSPHSDLPATLTSNWQVVNLASGSDHDLLRVTLPDLSKEEHVTFSRSGLARLKAGLDKAGLGARYFEWPPKDAPNRSPYPGLRPLEAEDAGIFFGREAPTVLALDRLRGLREAAPPRLLVIQGASGAGKSSFLRAGLIPRLRRDDTHFLPLPIIRPEIAAISGPTGLIHALEEAFRTRGGSLNRAEIAKAVGGGAAQLLPLLAGLAGQERAPNLLRGPSPSSLVFCVDQAEELFLAEGGEEAQTFLALLRDIALAEQPNVVIVFTIRSDSYELLLTAKALEGVRQESFPLPPMPRGAFQTIIEGPARRLEDGKRKLKLDPSLTDQLLADLAADGGKDALPLLAFTLERLYRQYGADGDLRLDEYTELGGVGGSIEAAVDAALKAADSDPSIPKDPAERLALLRRGLIPALAVIDPETRTPRRRVARMAEIPPEAQGLVKRLVEARLLTTDEVTENGERETVIEPAHEALLRQWKALNHWLKEDTAALLSLGGVQQAARDWEAHDRSADWLAHAGGRLEDAERLREREDFARFLAPLEQAYLRACRANEDHRLNRELEDAKKLADAQRSVARRTRIGLIVATVLLAAASVAAWFGFDRANIAEKQTAMAETQRAIAEKQTADARTNETISLSAFSTIALSRGETADAVKFALAAWPRKGDSERPQTRRAINALASALPFHHKRMQLEADSRLFVRHRNAVTSAAFSPDGARFVTSSEDGAARLWDARSGALLIELKGDGGIVTSAAFSPDGTRIVTASWDKTARIWDAQTGKTLIELKGHDDWVTSAAFSPDGARIVTASADKTARLWDAQAGKTLIELKGHDGNVSSAAFSPDGTRIVTASSDKTARIWDAQTGTELIELKGHDGIATSAAFNQDGTRVVIASSDGNARLWDAQTGKTLIVLKGHDGVATSAAFSPDGTRIVTASWDKTARIWDAQTGKTLIELSAHRNVVSTVAFSPDGKHIITASSDNTARLWDVRTGSVQSFAFSPNGKRVLTAYPHTTARMWDAQTGANLIELKGHDGSVFSAAFSPDGTQVVTASTDKSARVWNTQTGAMQIELKGHEGYVFTADFSPDGTRVVTASGDGAARLWDARSGKTLIEFEGHHWGVGSAAFSPDGKRVVTAPRDKTAPRLWDAQTGKMLIELTGHGDDVNSAAFSPDGRRIVTASSDKAARLWDAQTGKTLIEFNGHGGSVYSAAFSPDGRRVVTASADDTARLWDVQTGALLIELAGHEADVLSANFSPDGTRVVTASEDETARLWDTTTGTELIELIGHGKNVNSAAFSPDGKRVVTASSDKTARLWDVSDGIETGDGFAIACSRLGSDAHLAELAKRYGLAELRPICGDHPPAPIDWSKVIE